MLWNYHHEFGCCLLLERSLIRQKYNEFEYFKFLKVVRQHILGVVGNVIKLFSSKFNRLCFPAVKEFWKSVKIWRNYRHKMVAHFLGHSVDRGAGSVIKLVEPTRSWDVICDSSSGVQGHPRVRGWGQVMHPEAEALTNLYFFVAMLKTDALAGNVHFCKDVVRDLDLWIHDLV